MQCPRSSLAYQLQSIFWVLAFSSTAPDPQIMQTQLHSDHPSSILSSQAWDLLQPGSPRCFAKGLGKYQPWNPHACPDVTMLFVGINNILCVECMFLILLCTFFCPVLQNLLTSIDSEFPIRVAELDGLNDEEGLRY